jgi:predicted DNA-binding protein with PD1-like motif
MKNHIMRRALLSVALLLAASGNVFPQQPAAGAEERQKAESYTFVSPNTRENLTLEDAIRLLKSKEEQRFINNIHRLSRCLRLKPVVMKAIGSFTDGAEHSALFRVFTDEATLRYADARLGKLGRQKTVLYFRQDDSGAARMYVLRILPGKRTLAAIAETLDRNGVPFRTFVPVAGGRMLIYVVDLDHELSNHVVSAARNLGALMTTIKGMGEFIGDDTDRDKAQQVYAAIIKRYEDENPNEARRCASQ